MSSNLIIQFLKKPVTKYSLIVAGLLITSASCFKFNTQNCRGGACPQPEEPTGECDCSPANLNSTLMFGSVVGPAETGLFGSGDGWNVHRINITQNERKYNLICQSNHHSFDPTQFFKCFDENNAYEPFVTYIDTALGGNKFLLTGNQSSLVSTGNDNKLYTYALSSTSLIPALYCAQFTGDTAQSWVPCSEAATTPLLIASTSAAMVGAPPSNVLWQIGVANTVMGDDKIITVYNAAAGNTPHVLCYNLSTQSADCGGSYNSSGDTLLTAINSWFNSGNVQTGTLSIIEGKVLYQQQGNTNIACWNINDASECDADWNDTNVSSPTNQNANLVPYYDGGGTIIGACQLLGASVSPRCCWEFANPTSPATCPTELVTALQTYPISNWVTSLNLGIAGMYNDWDLSTKRQYWLTGNEQHPVCFDWNIPGLCDSNTFKVTASTFASLQTYTVTKDNILDNCFYVNGNFGGIRSFDGVTGASPCTATLEVPLNLDPNLQGKLKCPLKEFSYRIVPLAPNSTSLSNVSFVTTPNVIKTDIYDGPKTSTTTPVFQTYTSTLGTSDVTTVGNSTNVSIMFPNAIYPDDAYISTGDPNFVITLPSLPSAQVPLSYNIFATLTYCGQN